MLAPSNPLAAGEPGRRVEDHLARLLALLLPGAAFRAPRGHATDSNEACSLAGLTVGLCLERSLQT